MKRENKWKRLRTKVNEKRNSKGKRSAKKKRNDIFTIPRIIQKRIIKTNNSIELIYQNIAT